MHKGETPIVAIDCEMVMCTKNGIQTHELARVSIVNYNGHILMDQYVRPVKKITNYLTWVSGITEKSIRDAPSLVEVKNQIC